MTENEAIKELEHSIISYEMQNRNNITCDLTQEVLDFAIQALEEIQTYRAIGLTPEQIEAMQGHNIALINDLGEYQAIGTVKEIRIREAQSVRLSEGYLSDLTLLRKYQEIGTVEELQVLKEKNEPKKVIGIKANLQNRYCPSCNEWMTFEIKKGMKYCPNCGQKLDWSINTIKTEGYIDQSGLMPAT